MLTVLTHGATWLLHVTDTWSSDRRCSSKSCTSNMKLHKINFWSHWKKKLFKNIYDYSIDVNKYPYWFLFKSTNSYGRLLGSNAPWQPWLPFYRRTTIARLEISECRYSDIVKCMGIRTGTDFSDFYFWPHMRYRIFGRRIIQNGLIFY